MYGTLGQIRTDTLLVLSQLTLPIGLQGHWGERGNRTLADCFTDSRAATTLLTPLKSVTSVRALTAFAAT